MPFPHLCSLNFFALPSSGRSARSTPLEIRAAAEEGRAGAGGGACKWARYWERRAQASTSPDSYSLYLIYLMI